MQVPVQRALLLLRCMRCASTTDDPSRLQVLCLISDPDELWMTPLFPRESETHILIYCTIHHLEKSDGI